MCNKEEALAKFKEFCLAEFGKENDEEKFDPSEEQDWYSLSLGFFGALGLNSEDSHSLALESRYDFHYWC